MEKLELFNKNGINYFQKDGQNILLSYNLPMSLFSSDFKNIQLNNRPIIKKKNDIFETIEKTLGDFGDKFGAIPESAKEMVKGLLKNKGALQDMLKNMGISESLANNVNIDFEDGDNLSKTAFEMFKMKTGIEFSAILGRDILLKYILLFEKGLITFFSERFEVGEVVGKKFTIVDLKKIPYGVFIKDFIKIGDKNLNFTFDINTKNIYLKKDSFLDLMNNIKNTPETKMELDFFNDLGSLNSTLFKLKSNLMGEEKDLWIGELPDFKNIVFKNISEIDGVFSIDSLERDILIDGIHNKFGYKK